MGNFRSHGQNGSAGDGADWLTANALSYRSKRDSGRSGRNALI